MTREEWANLERTMWILDALEDYESIPLIVDLLKHPAGQGPQDFTPGEVAQRLSELSSLGLVEVMEEDLIRGRLVPIAPDRDKIIAGSGLWFGRSVTGRAAVQAWAASDG